MTIKYIQIETTSSCNQRCTFCPVSVENREKKVLSLDSLDKILTQLKENKIEKIYINGFNEPTYDKQIAEKTSLINKYQIPVSFLSNGSGLNPELVKQLIDNSVLEYTINLSTLDPLQYKKVRGNNDIIKVLPNVKFLLEYGKTFNIHVSIMILGGLDEVHANNVNDLYQYFSNYLDDNVSILICPAVDFAADMTKISSEKIYHKKLSGCIHQRHKQWLHITAAGNTILCCQDYQEKYKTSHVDNEAINKILVNERSQQYRRWVEGDEEAPEDFICRKCIFALSDDDYENRVKSMFCKQCVLPQKIEASINPCDFCVVKQV